MKTKVIELLTILGRAETLIKEIKEEAVLSNTRARKKRQSETEKIGKMNLEEFLASTSFEFVTWICGSSISTGRCLDRTILRHQFLLHSNGQSDFVTPKRFANWMMLYSQYSGLRYKPVRSHGKRYIVLTALTQPANENLKIFE